MTFWRLMSDMFRLDTRSAAKSSVPRVVVTRSQPGAEALAEELAAHGMDVLTSPLLAPHYEADPQILDYALHAYVGILATSANGLFGLHRACGDEAQDVQPRCYCVGEGTQRVAESLGWPAFHPPSVHDGHSLARWIDAEPSIAKGPWLYPCGAESLDVVPNYLRQRGHEVTSWKVYSMRRLPLSIDDWQSFLVRPALVLFYSPSAVRACREQLQSIPGLRRRVQEVAGVVAIGNTTSEACRQDDWTVVAKAEKPTTDAVVAAIRSAWPEWLSASSQ